MYDTIRGLLLATLILLGGCSNGDGDGVSTSAHASEIPLPCFLGDGLPVCRINGVPVPRKAWDGYRAFYRERNPVWTDLQVSLNTLEKILIPRAVAYAMAGDGLKELSRQAWEAHDRLVDREPWDDVLRAYSKDPKNIESGGLVGTHKRDAKELGPLGAAFIHHFWNQPVLVPSRPFVEYHGVFILQVTAETPGAGPATTERTARAIYLPYTPELLSGKAGPTLQTALRRAVVSEISDPELDRILPAVYRGKR